MLKISARNQLNGVVTHVEKGAVNGDVLLDIGNGNTIQSNITNAAIDELNIRQGDQVVAIIKSSSIILATGPKLNISARNQLEGTIRSVGRGAVNSEIKIELPSAQVITAIVTCETVEELGLAAGMPCRALVKASHVILAKEQ